MGDDTIYAGNGNEILIGGAGSDQLFGGGGADVAAFSGNMGDYLISQSGIGISITDINLADGDDGTDQLLGFEKYRLCMTIRSPQMLRWKG